MRPYVYYLPVAVFLAAALLTRARVDFRDARLVRRPGGMWTLPRVLRDSEWTAEGLIARRRWLRALGATFALGALAWVAVLAVAGQG